MAFDRASEQGQSRRQKENGSHGGCSVHRGEKCNQDGDDAGEGHPHGDTEDYQRDAQGTQ